MLAKPEAPQIPLPKGWQGCVKSAVVHVISLAHYAIVYARAWAADGTVNLSDSSGKRSHFSLPKFLIARSRNSDFVQKSSRFSLNLTVPSRCYPKVFGQVHFIAQDPDNQNVIVPDQINDEVLGVMMHPHWRGIFWAFGGNARIIRDDVDSIAKALLVALRLVSAKIQETVEVAIDYIGVGLCSEPNLHAVRVFPHAPVPRPKSHRASGG
jgi:hypothetical protein